MKAFITIIAGDCASGDGIGARFGRTYENSVF